MINRKISTWYYHMWDKRLSGTTYFTTK